jgi:hypothetical protein
MNTLLWCRQEKSSPIPGSLILTRDPAREPISKVGRKRPAFERSCR